MTLDQVKVVYRAAIDSTADDREGDTWWSEVADEILRVVAAPTVATAAAEIDWWHSEWSSVNDSPRAAAGRIRASARMVSLNS